MFDRKTFFDGVRLPVFHDMSQKQVDGCNAILAEIEARQITDTRFCAYMLATVAWETAHTMQPIEEYGHGKGHAYGVPTGPWHQVYDGRGDVQLTWAANYRKATTRLRALGVIGADVDLERDPALALRPDIAAAVLIYGMIEGWFTGKKLGDYFTATRSDFLDARRIVNGTDHAADIAAIAAIFRKALVPASAEAPSASPSQATAPAPRTAPPAAAAMPASAALTHGPSGQPSAPASVQPTAAPTKESTMFNLSTLASLAALAQAAMSVAHDYSAAAPALVTDAKSLETNGKAVVSDIGSLVGHIKSGQYADTPDDVQRGFSDLGKILATVEGDVPKIANLVTSTAKGLPSPSGVASVLATLGKV